MRVHVVGDTPEIVVAGIPRTGTRWITNQLGGKDFKAVAGNVYKTHGLAPPEYFYNPRHDTINELLMEGGWKAIFMFGDPVASVISTINNIFDRNHFNNCGVVADPKDIDITKEDKLNYERMFDSWMKPHPYPVIALRYETLPHHKREIEEFTGVTFDFSKWKARKYDW